jgi:hypothetical protein
MVGENRQVAPVETHVTAIRLKEPTTRPIAVKSAVESEIQTGAQCSRITRRSVFKFNGLGKQSVTCSCIAAWAKSL